MISLHDVIELPWMSCTSPACPTDGNVQVILCPVGICHYSHFPSKVGLKKKEKKKITRVRVVVCSWNGGGRGGLGLSCVVSMFKYSVNTQQLSGAGLSVYIIYRI